VIYELRTYIIVPGRIADIEKRFADTTLRLFEKHGMRVVGFWRTIGEGQPIDELVYVLAHESPEAREASFEGFRSDPEWLTAKETSERDGAIVARVESKFLAPTAYSPLQ
jgi:hypothetical protein